jgi:hypothetical protein
MRTISIILISALILISISFAGCSSKPSDKGTTIPRTVTSNGNTSHVDATPTSVDKTPNPSSDSPLAWTKPPSRPPRFLFIHHSTGSGFLDEGNMRQMLIDSGLDVHDRTYGDGWVGDHTDPPDFPVTFTNHFDDMISWDLPDGQKYDIVAFKSCFPASNIASDEQLKQYKDYYATIKSVTSKHPETLFIAFSTPPLVPGDTSPENAARARAFANWLVNDYQTGEPNLRVYNLFDLLADSSGFLKKEFRRDEEDSHPNPDANKAVAADFTKWLSELIG